MKLSWGLPRQFVRLKSSETTNPNPIIELYKPTEGSTELTPTKGDKKEAKIEGGENEAVKYSKNTYALTTAFRIGDIDGTHRKKPVADSDGVIEGEYEYWLLPEDENAPGLHMPRCVLSVEDGWTAEDGGVWTYTIDAVKEVDHDQVEWGSVKLVAKEGGKTDYMSSLADITFTETTEPNAE